jgi:hypothetical protein
MPGEVVRLVGDWEGCTEPSLCMFFEGMVVAANLLDNALTCDSK